MITRPEPNEKPKSLRDAIPPDKWARMAVESVVIGVIAAVACLLFGIDAITGVVIGAVAVGIAFVLNVAVFTTTRNRRRATKSRKRIR